MIILPDEQQLVKVHYQDSQERLWKACHGCMNVYLDDNLMKQAASDVFTRDIIEHHRRQLKPWEYLIHTVAMGAGEKYGHNKNGDDWPKQACVDYHHTFVEDGYFYKEHRNRDPKTQSMGKVAASMWNDDLDRIELLIKGDRRLSEEMYCTVKSGRVTKYSMSARLPWDECSCCHNKAASRRTYCPHLADRMMQWIPEFQKYAYAINRKPRFFDISDVGNPADITAQYLSYAFPNGSTADLQKAASELSIISGADWATAEGVNLPGVEIKPDPFTGRRMSILHKLASEELWFANFKHASGPKQAFVKWNGNYVFDDSETMPFSDMERLRRIRPASLTHEMAKRATFFTFPMFASYVYGQPVEEVMKKKVVKQACDCIVPNVFSHLFNQGGAPKLDMFDPCDSASANMDSENDDAVQGIMDDISDKLSIKSGPAKSRIVITIEKKASKNLVPVPLSEMQKSDIDSEAVALSEMFGVFKLATFEEMLRMHSDIDDQEYTMAVLQNQMFR